MQVALAYNIQMQVTAFIILYGALIRNSKQIIIVFMQVARPKTYRCQIMLLT